MKFFAILNVSLLFLSLSSYAQTAESGNGSGKNSSAIEKTLTCSVFGHLKSSPITIQLSTSGNYTGPLDFHDNVCVEGYNRNYGHIAVVNGLISSIHFVDEYSNSSINMDFIIPQLEQTVTLKTFVYGQGKITQGIRCSVE